jgi:hypothetical protein
VADVVDAREAVVVVERIGHVQIAAGRRIEAAQQVQLGEVLRGDRELLEVTVVLAVHRQHVVELVEVLDHELPRAAGELDPVAHGLGAAAGIGALADVISAGARAVDCNVLPQPRLVDQVLHHAFRRGRAADVAETHEAQLDLGFAHCSLSTASGDGGTTTAVGRSVRPFSVM